MPLNVSDDGRLVDGAKIGRAAQRILSASPVARLFTVDIAQGHCVYDYDRDALAYETLLAGRYVLVTSLTPDQACTTQIVSAYRSLIKIERRFRVLKDFLHLRPVRHWTERRVRGHIAVCVHAAVIEALIAAALHAADVRDPDLDNQHLSCARALRELGRIRNVTLNAASRHMDLVTRRDPLQTRILATVGVDTSNWNRAHIH